MVCDDVRRIAYFFLDGELGEQKQRDMENHLTACHSCDGRVVIHRRFRAFIRHRLSRLHAPPTLRDRIHSALGPRNA
ncbi:MAG: anti-sigma factor family protein [Thermoanaerobaculia bacterium]